MENSRATFVTESHDDRYRVEYKDTCILADQEPTNRQYMLR